MPKFFGSAKKKLGQSLHQKKRKKLAQTTCPNGSEWKNSSLVADRKCFYKDLQDSFDARFAVKTANRFAVFEKSAGDIPSQHRNGEPQILLKNNSRREAIPEIYPACTDLPDINNHHTFFTIEQLDNQFRIFNLTKYAHPELLKPSSDSFGNPPPTTPKLGRSLPDSKPPSSYIPPHRRSPVKTADKPIRISIKEVEDTWSECLKGGVFAIWTGPLKKLSLLSDWLEENCEDQVRIYHYSDRILYLQCEEESVKKAFVSVSECFFIGHSVKFIGWSHDFHIEKLDCMISKWFIMPSLPPELLQVDIINSIGSAVGEVLGIESSFYCCNSVKLLINTKFNHPSNFQKKVITNKASYDLNFHTYKGNISDILKFDDIHKIRPKILPLTSDFRSMFPWLRIMKNKRKQNYREQDSPANLQKDFVLQTEPLHTEATNSRRLEDHSADKERLKSIIVTDYRDKTKLDGNGRTHKKHKGKKESKAANFNKDSSRRVSTPTQQQQINGEKENGASGKHSSPTSKLVNRGTRHNKSLSNNLAEAEKDNKRSIIEERENILLFNCEADIIENYISQKETNDLEKIQAQDMAEKSPPLATRKPCKFWQTPTDSKTSPFTPSCSHQDKKMNSNTADKVPIKEFQEFLNSDNALVSPLGEGSISKIEEDRLNLLTEQLVQVFSEENIEESTDAQKEELIKELLILGGNNYTYEDLRKDLLKIENEDNNQRQSQIKEQDEQQKQKEKDDSNTSIVEADLGLDIHSSIYSQFLKELAQEEKNGSPESKIGVAKKIEANLEQLGIQMNQEGITSPICGRMRGKRGRKSLKELREADGHNKEQQKIDQIFNIGKGKCLPKEQ